MSENQLCTLEISRPFKDLKSIRFITSPKGEPQSVIISIEEFTSLLDTLNLEAKEDLIDSVKQARQQLKDGNPLLTFEDVFGENF